MTLAPSLWGRTGSGYNLIGQDVITVAVVNGISVLNADGTARSYLGWTNTYLTAVGFAGVLYIAVNIDIEIGGKTKMPKINTGVSHFLNFKIIDRCIMQIPEIWFKDSSIL